MFQLKVLDQDLAVAKIKRSRARVNSLTPNIILQGSKEKTLGRNGLTKCFHIRRSVYLATLLSSKLFESYKSQLQSNFSQGNVKKIEIYVLAWRVLAKLFSHSFFVKVNFLILLNWGDFFSLSFLFCIVNFCCFLHLFNWISCCYNQLDLCRVRFISLWF